MNSVTVANLNAVRLLEIPASVNEPHQIATADTDGEIMRNLADGNEAAMQSLIERHGEMLNRLIGRLTAWDAEHEDILQNVLVAIWQRAGDYQGSGSLEGWIRRIAINRCRNHFRARTAFRRLLSLFATRSRVTESANNKDITRIDDQELTRAALQKLNQQDRTVLVLFYLEELTGDEIAQLTGVKVETVHVQLHRARKRLREQLGVLEDSS
jgi:RNA polymerase sigma-70 factor (ECF subfamily)